MLQHGSVASKGVHQYNSNGTLDFKEPQAPWDAPLLFNHRGDLHAQLKLLATAPGKGCSGAQIITCARVVDVVGISLVLPDLVMQRSGLRRRHRNHTGWHSLQGRFGELSAAQSSLADV
jgi:hypothetical protein